ncbi:hypothetical protein MJI37_31055, partial [Salmonella enterica subsp. enterica serovar Cerro]|nr:hypothetical protein [Salmonella enterica subsp. enterica serovar Cerro]
LDEAFSRLTSAATGTLLERLQQWALERHSLIVLFERKHFPFLFISMWLIAASRFRKPKEK